MGAGASLDALEVALGDNIGVVVPFVQGEGELLFCEVPGL